MGSMGGFQVQAPLQLTSDPPQLVSRWGVFSEKPIYEYACLFFVQMAFN
jgi:hypothetical protein